MEILRTEKLTGERWLNLFVRTYRRNGKEKRWVFASRQDEPPVPARGCDGVIVVPILAGTGTPPLLVVIREYRVPLGDYEYSFPAGLVEPGENIEQVARRELREEAGLEIAEITKVSPPTYSSSGLTDECVTMVFVRAVAPAGWHQSLDDSEDIEVLRLDYGQVCELCDSAARINGRAWPVLYMYQHLGRLA